ncbi:GNAT family N-acetyltransferase [Corallococcus terminator]
MLEHAFQSLGVRRLFALTQPGNLGAIRLAESLGLHRVTDGRYERVHP